MRVTPQVPPSFLDRKSNPQKGRATMLDASRFQAVTLLSTVTVIVWGVPEGKRYALRRGSRTPPSHKLSLLQGLPLSVSVPISFSVFIYFRFPLHEKQTKPLKSLFPPPAMPGSKLPVFISLSNIKKDGSLFVTVKDLKQL